MQEYLLTFASDKNPLVLHNDRLANPLDPYAQLLKDLSSEKHKTEKHHLRMARVEWEGGLYWDDEIGPYLPIKYPLASMREAARITRDGKRFVQATALMAEDGGSRMPIKFDAPKDWKTLVGDREKALEVLWEDERCRDMSMVGVNIRSKILRTRPRFENWSFSFIALLEDSVIDYRVFEKIAMRAGRLAGLGEAPEGVRARFDVTIEPRGEQS